MWAGWMTSVAWAQAPSPAGVPKPLQACLLADFRALALTTHDPQVRLESAIAWLQSQSSFCSLDQLKILNNYRASWMGSADHPKVQGLIDSLIEAKAANNPQLLKELFTPSVTPPPATEMVGVTAKPNPSPSRAAVLPPIGFGVPAIVQPLPQGMPGQLPSGGAGAVAPTSPAPQ